MSEALKMPIKIPYGEPFSSPPHSKLSLSTSSAFDLREMQRASGHAQQQQQQQFTSSRPRSPTPPPPPRYYVSSPSSYCRANIYGRRSRSSSPSVNGRTTPLQPPTTPTYEMEAESGVNLTDRLALRDNNLPVSHSRELTWNPDSSVQAQDSAVSVLQRLFHLAKIKATSQQQTGTNKTVVFCDSLNTKQLPLRKRSLVSTVEHTPQGQTVAGFPTRISAGQRSNYPRTTLNVPNSQSSVHHKDSGKSNVRSVTLNVSRINANIQKSQSNTHQQGYFKLRGRPLSARSSESDACTKDGQPGRFQNTNLQKSAQSTSIDCIASQQPTTSFDCLKIKGLKASFQSAGSTDNLKSTRSILSSEAGIIDRPTLGDAGSLLDAQKPDCRQGFATKDEQSLNLSSLNPPLWHAGFSSSRASSFKKSCISKRTCYHAASVHMSHQGKKEGESLSEPFWDQCSFCNKSIWNKTDLPARKPWEPTQRQCRSSQPKPIRAILLGRQLKPQGALAADRTSKNSPRPSLSSIKQENADREETVKISSREWLLGLDNRQKEETRKSDFDIEREENELLLKLQSLRGRGTDTGTARPEPAEQKCDAGHECRPSAEVSKSVSANLSEQEYVGLDGGTSRVKQACPSASIQGLDWDWLLKNLSRSDSRINMNRNKHTTKRKCHAGNTSQSTTNLIPGYGSKVWKSSFVTSAVIHERKKECPDTCPKSKTSDLYYVNLSTVPSHVNKRKSEQLVANKKPAQINHQLDNPAYSGGDTRETSSGIIVNRVPAHEHETSIPQTKSLSALGAFHHKPSDFQNNTKVVLIPYARESNISANNKTTAEIPPTKVTNETRTPEESGESPYLNSSEQAAEMREKNLEIASDFSCGDHVSSVPKPTENQTEFWDHHSYSLDDAVSSYWDPQMFMIRGNEKTFSNKSEQRVKSNRSKVQRLSMTARFKPIKGCAFRKKNKATYHKTTSGKKVVKKPPHPKPEEVSLDKKQMKTTSRHKLRDSDNSATSHSGKTSSDGQAASVNNTSCRPTSAIRKKPGVRKGVDRTDIAKKLTKPVNAPTVSSAHRLSSASPDKLNEFYYGSKVNNGHVLKGIQFAKIGYSSSFAKRTALSPNNTTISKDKADQDDDEEDDDDEEENSESEDEDDDDDDDDSEEEEDETEDEESENEDSESEESDGDSEDSENEFREENKSDPVQPLSEAMMKKYCQEVKERGGWTVSKDLLKAISRWNTNDIYDKFSRVKQSSFSRREKFKS